MSERFGVHRIRLKLGLEALLAFALQVAQDALKFRVTSDRIEVGIGFQRVYILVAIVDGLL